MNKVSIIIRTKNEERWIKTCLNSLKNQSHQSFEIVLVDNLSTDRTLEIVSTHVLSKRITVVEIEEYVPGRALNIGIENSTGEIIVCISAHCIPSNNTWLSSLIQPLSESKKIVATYGRQIPMPYSNPEDVRDLLLVFSKDERLQKNDYFFHNAHSAFYRKVWSKFPFNDKLTNIEDREFGKNLIENNYRIYYNPIPTVYHYHGIHQSGNSKRLEGVIHIMKSLDTDSELERLPDVCSIDYQSTLVFLPLLNKELSESEARRLVDLCDKLCNLKSIKSVLIISFETIHHYFENLSNVKSFNREIIKDHLTLGVFELIRKVFLRFGNCLDYDIGVYLNVKNELDQIDFNSLQNRLSKFPKTGVDILFPASKDYGYYWYFENNKYYPTSFEKSVRLKENRNFLFKAHYGMGSVFDLLSLQAGDLLNSNILIDEIN
ncbi:glycosyltransferase [Schleiferiaceae bacterium]|nr:glycosyltransferase [Schleiferiaceae bacterium]